MENKIKYTLEILNSKSDIYGNRYFAMVVTRTSDGATAHGNISGGESNCTSAIMNLSGGEWGHFTYTRSELPIREFKRMTKYWPYLGCTPKEINPNIVAQMDNNAKG